MLRLSPQEMHLFYTERHPDGMVRVVRASDNYQGPWCHPDAAMGWWEASETAAMMKAGKSTTYPPREAKQ